MKNSLFIYETYYGTARKTAEAFALIFANSKAADINAAPEDIKVYDNVVFVFAFHGYATAEKTKKYIEKMSGALKEKTVALCGVGLSPKDLENYKKPLAEALGREFDSACFVEGELRVKNLTKEDKETLEKFLKSQNMKLMDMGKFKMKDVCDAAENLRININKVKNQLDREKLQQSIDEFLKSHNTCTLATGIGNYIRSTPIEYMYSNNAVYFITEGGLKFKGILQNPNVSISIYDCYSDMKNIKGMQIEGRAEIIPMGSDEYVKIIAKKNLDMEKLKRFPISLNMIKVCINKIEFLNSDFRKAGADVKQEIKYI